MRYNVLCGCGWGRLAMPEEDIPEFCPVCGFRFADLWPDEYEVDTWDTHGPESESE